MKLPQSSNKGSWWRSKSVQIVTFSLKCKKTIPHYTTKCNL